MSLIALVSAKGSPGVSTAALAFTLAWPGPTLLAELDPAGGDLARGFLVDFPITPDRGLLPLTIQLRQFGTATLEAQLIDLSEPRGKRMALPGVLDPLQGATLPRSWPALADLLTSLPPTSTIIADCGRLDLASSPTPILARADMVLLVVRPTSVRPLSQALPATQLLQRYVADAGGMPQRIGLLTVNAPGKYKVSVQQLAQHLHTPVVAQLPWDPSTAAWLTGEGPAQPRGQLIRHAASAEDAIRGAIVAARPEAVIAR